jgi:hypothetical protein
MRANSFTVYFVCQEASAMTSCLITRATLLACSVSTAVYADVTLYNDQATWAAATTGVAFAEYFDDTALECGLQYITDAGYISGGQFRDRVTRWAGESTTFQWAMPVDAVGAVWDLSPGGPGQGLALTAEIHSGGMVSVHEIPNVTVGSFIGFVSDTPIDKLVISAGTQAGVAETYTVDNLVWTESAKTVSIEGCTSEIENRLLNGCSLDYQINTLANNCEHTAENHGDYVSCVSHTTRPLLKNGELTGSERGAIIACAAQSDAGKKD